MGSPEPSNLDQNASPQSPHNLRKFVSTSSSDSDDSNSENLSEVKKPPKPFNQKKELRMHENKMGAYVSAPNRGRERTRISAVQRQIERKMAQKEKEKEKERATLFQRRSSSVGSNKFADQDNDSNACNSLSRSLSRDRLDSTSKTYIRISSEKSSIKENSPSKKVENLDNTKEILGQNFEPLKTTEILKDLNSDKIKTDDNDNEIKATRKISFTTEKTIVIGDSKNVKVEENPKMRKVSIDINYVYEHQHTNKTQIKDEKIKENEASKRRISLERRFKERRS